MEMVADLGLVFGWTPRDVDNMYIEEIYDYHEKAIERLKYKISMGL